MIKEGVLEKITKLRELRLRKEKFTSGLDDYGSPRGEEIMTYGSQVHPTNHGRASSSAGMPMMPMEIPTNHGRASSAGMPMMQLSRLLLTTEPLKKDADLAGIGIAFGRDKNKSETSALFILLVHPNGPAARTGHLEPMQEIISVDAWPVYGQDLATIAQHVRGPAGTHVILEVLTLASKGHQTLQVVVEREHAAYCSPTAPVPFQGRPLDPSHLVAEVEADTRAALVAQIPQVMASDTTASCVHPRLLNVRDLVEETECELEEAAVLHQASTYTSATVGTFRKDDVPEATKESLEAVNHFSRALSVEIGQELIIESLSSCSPKASCGIPSPPEEATVLEQACTVTQVEKMTGMEGTAGIGIRFGCNEDGSETSAVFILFVHPNGPAARTGHFEAMQELISVDDWPVCGHDLATIAQHVRGPVGTHVILEVLTLASKGRQTLQVAVAREHTACSGPTDPLPFKKRPAEAETDTRAALDVQIPQLLTSNTTASCVLPGLLDETDLEETTALEPDMAGTGGIGIRFGRNEDGSETSAMFILLVHPNGPAARTGHFEPMQELISVDGWSVCGQDLATIVQHVRGPVGTHVILEVLTLASKGRQTLKVAVAREHTACSGPTDPIPFQGRPLDPSARVAEAEEDTRAALDVQIPQLLTSNTTASCVLPGLLDETCLEEVTTLEADMAGTGGIGIRFGRNEDGSETSAVFILLVHPNGPAARTGHFEPMQELISVDGWPVCGHDLATIAQHVRGPVATHVILEVLTLASKGRQTLKVAVVREHTNSGPINPLPCQGRPSDHSPLVAEAEADTRAALDVQIPQVLSSDTTASSVLPRLLEKRDLKEASVFELEQAMVSLVLPPIPEDAPSRACSGVSQACTLTQDANVADMPVTAGVGIRFGYNEDDSETSAVFILVVHPNGPAARTGHLEPMQELISVDAWPVCGQDLATIARHVRGPVGTHIILEVLTLASKGRQTLKVAVTREHTQ